MASVSDLARLALRVAEARWVTIGAKAGKDGEKVGGTPVELDDAGNIVKGPSKMTGKKPDEIKKSDTPKKKSPPGENPDLPPQLDQPKPKKDWEDAQDEKHKKALGDIKDADKELASLAAQAKSLMAKVSDPEQKAKLQAIADRAENKSGPSESPKAEAPKPSGPKRVIKSGEMVGFNGGDWKINRITTAPTGQKVVVLTGAKGTKPQVIPGDQFLKMVRSGEVSLKGAK